MSHRPGWATPVRRIVLLLVVLSQLAFAGCGAPRQAPVDASQGDDPAAAATSAGLPSTRTPPVDVCAALAEADVSSAVGGTVALETGPSGDCEFSQEDPRAVSGTLGVVADADTNGGFEGYLTGISGTVEQLQRQTLDGLGAAAVTYTGLPKMGSGENYVAGGVVDHGTFLVQVTLVQGHGIPATELEQTAEKLLRLLDRTT